MARRGNTTVILALSSSTLLGMAALTIDLGYARLVQVELQNLADAAAHAGSAQLDGTDEGVLAAITMARYVASMNPVAGQTLDLADEDLTVGYWDATARAFTATTDPQLANTLRVNANLAALDLLFAPLTVGVSSMPIRARSAMAAAQGGAGGVDCYLPIAVPQCLIDRWTLEGLQDVTLNLNPASIDSMGWGRPNGTPNASWSRDQIVTCTQNGTARVGEPVGLQNGVVTSAMSQVATSIGTSTTSWDTAKWGAQPARMSGSAVSAGAYGHTLEGVIVVFDGGPNYCIGSGGAFNGEETISGFLWAALYDVKTSGSAASKTMKLRLDPETEHVAGTLMGGPDWGVTIFEPPRMVE